MASRKSAAVLRGVLVGCLATCVAVLAAATWLLIERPPNDIDVALDAASARSAVGGPFAMADHNGNAVSDADFRGQFLLMFFGYTFCPDICPTELGTIAAALDMLGPEADQVTPVFVTIDPARDTADVVAEYVALFHPKFIGLTGTAQQLADMARAYQVFYAKGPGDGEDYLMEHTGLLYLMGPDGEFRGVLPPGTSPDELAGALRLHFDG